MVAPTSFNLDTLRGRTFKGFVQFQEPSGAWFRMKERQTMGLNFRFDLVKHYTDDGTLNVDPSGISHTFDMRIKLTSDLFDDEFTANSDKKTLSYWIYKASIHEPLEIIFVTTIESLIGPTGATDEKFTNLKFTLVPNTFSPSFGATGGSVEMAISGVIINIVEAVRDSSAEQA